MSNEKLADALNAAAEGHVGIFSDVIGDILNDKIRDRLEVERVVVAQKFFNTDEEDDVYEEGYDADDLKGEPDSDDEAKKYKPRSKGEEDFVAQHTATKLAHPVATDAQFTGEIKKGQPDHHVGGKKQAPGEGIQKQGSSKVK